MNDLNELSIPRETAVPPLSPSEIATITQTVFIPNNIQPADLLFIFGASTIAENLWEIVAAYFRQNYFRQIIVTGLTGRAYYETGRPLAHLLCDQLLAHGIPDNAILMQDQSTNTYEDVRFSLDKWPELSSLTNIAFLAKSHHSGRCLRTLRKFVPRAQLNALTYNAVYDGVVVAKHNWYDYPISRGRVYGEYLRIQKYAAQGDIAP
ncbi:MAG: YdcF family protein [Chloroflexi bacterium]|nr:YdcF family protein [Chloroflexota bacterium]